jgi:hypothetical protein
LVGININVIGLVFLHLLGLNERIKHEKQRWIENETTKYNKEGDEYATSDLQLRYQFRS